LLQSACGLIGITEGSAGSNFHGAALSSLPAPASNDFQRIVS
jgi:hypothetical protein